MLVPIYVPLSTATHEKLLAGLENPVKHETDPVQRPTALTAQI
jgi:hypothetical protein